MATEPSLPSGNPPEDIVAAEALAAVLKVDPHTVLNWAKAGIIPESFRVGTLLNDEQEGLNRFVSNGKDIQLFLRTYSNSGN